MRRRNLAREVRHLTPHVPAPREAAIAALRRSRLGLAIAEALEADATLQAGTDEARRAGIRRAFDQHLAQAQAIWVGGAPTKADLAVAERRVADLLGLSREELAQALPRHARPKTVG